MKLLHERVHSSGAAAEPKEVRLRFRFAGDEGELFLRLRVVYGAGTRRRGEPML